MSPTLEDAKNNFPYETLRDAQEDGIEGVIEAIDDEGFLVLEGACGTGKTMLSLSGLLPYIEQDNTGYERIVVATSVKQQMEIFEDEMRAINEERESTDKDPFMSVTMAGKGDIYPYVKHGAIDYHEVQEVSERLRDGTRRKLAEAENKQKVAGKIQEREMPSGGNMVTKFDSDGVYKYPFEVSEVPDGNYDPFYAGYLETMYDAMGDDGYDPADVIPFDADTAGVISIPEMVQTSGEAGMCPHSILGEAMNCADVVIGNYLHVFDEQTRNFTEDILDEKTLLVVDEAHNLVSRVRDIYSQEKTMAGFAGDIKHLEMMDAMINDTVQESSWENAGAMASDSSFLKTGMDVGKATDLYADMAGRSVTGLVGTGFDGIDRYLDDTSLANITSMYLDMFTSFYDRISEYLEDNSSLEPDEDILFQDPDKLDTDRFTQWAQLFDYEVLFQHLDAFGELMTKMQEYVSVELYDETVVSSNIEEMCSFWHFWYTSDQDRYFRMGSVEEREYLPVNSRHLRDWQEETKVSLQVKNCLPRDEIKETVSSLGGGVFMSATLEPIPEYVEETGLSLFDDRPVIQRSYGLRFPPENRETLLVDTPKFKYSNRGSAWTEQGRPNTGNNTRREYKALILNVVETTPGNVLIVMPSYSEASWAGKIIRSNTSMNNDDVLIDEQSRNEETQELKEEFFNGSDQVLVTGARGTLTEGVDYEGERLAAALVCGVPIVNTNSPINNAIETTYDRYFDDGFEFAFTLPAVRKSRQAIGRVIRGFDEVGVRVLGDERYCPSIDNWDEVTDYFPESFFEEATECSTDDSREELETFWRNKK